MKVKFAKSVKAGIGAGMAVSILLLLSFASDSTWLMAPFGASCVLLFSAPASPLSQPKNLVFGHVISTFVGLIFAHYFGNAAWVIAVSVALAIALMVFFDVVHPPAGADPIVVLLSMPSLSFLVFPVLTGSLALLVVAYVFHHFSRDTDYPLSTRKYADQIKL